VTVHRPQVRRGIEAGFRLGLRLERTGSNFKVQDKVRREKGENVPLALVLSLRVADTIANP
jgi:hypothetical protein